MGSQPLAPGPVTDPSGAGMGDESLRAPPRSRPGLRVAVVVVVALLVVTVGVFAAYRVAPGPSVREVTLLDDQPPIQVVTTGPNALEADWQWGEVPSFPATAPVGGTYNLTFLLENGASINFTITSFYAKLPYSYASGLGNVVLNDSWDHIALNLTMPTTPGTYQIGLVIQAS